MAVVFSADQLAHARGRWDVIAGDIALRRHGRELIGLCPFHDERTPSFTIAERKGFFHCFGCGAHGTPIDFVMRRRGLDFVAAVRELLDLPAQRPRMARPSPASGERVIGDENAIERVLEVLRGCVPCSEATPAGIYLSLRGLDGRAPGLLAHPDLYCHEIRSTLPALVAPIACGPEGEVTAVQRIWVRRQNYFDGRPLSTSSIRVELKTRKKTLGHMHDGAVRLAAAGRVLGFAEGVETALAAMAIYKVPVWASCGVHRLGYPAHWRKLGTPPSERPEVWIPPVRPPSELHCAWIEERPPSIWVPDEVEQILIFGDSGDTGEVIAEHAADWWRRQGRAAEAIFPKPGFGDFNDELLGVR